jgi:RNA polymerase sigma-70 factor (ECF subfamily)
MKSINDEFLEIMYQLWKSFPDLKKRDSLGSWIYKVAINTSISRIRKASRIEYRPKLPDICDKTVDTAEAISRNTSLHILLEAVSNLDEIDRSIMLLWLDENSYDQIAGIIGISPSNVGVRINRAKETLRKLMNTANH